MTPEGKVKQKVRKLLDELHIYYVMVNTGGYGNSGAPDFICCFQGVFIGIECKAGGNKPTALQLSHLADIERSGGISLVVDESNIDQLREILINKRLLHHV